MLDLKISPVPRKLLCGIITILTCAGIDAPAAFCSKISTPNANLIQTAPSSTVSFAQIPTSSQDIGLSAENVKVRIKRMPEISAIDVSSNCPSHWNVTNNIIRQVAFSTTAKGVSVRADATGAQAIVNGHIYQLPQDSNGAVHSLKIENGQVIINGQKLDPILGSDVPGPCTGPTCLRFKYRTATAAG